MHDSVYDGDFQMPLNTVQSGKSNYGEDNAQAYEPYERKDGFYSSCGQAFIRVPNK